MEASLFIITGAYGRRWAALASKLLHIPCGPLSVPMIALAACKPVSGHWMPLSRYPHDCAGCAIGIQHAQHIAA